MSRSGGKTSELDSELVTLYCTFILALIITSMPSFSFAAGPVIEVPQEFKSTRLGRKVELALDPHNRASVEQLLADGTRPLEFKTPDRDTPNYGFIPSTSWARFVLHNPTSERRRLFIEADYPLLDDVQLYERSLEKGALDSWRRRAAGDKVPFRERELNFVNVSFELELAPGESRQCYIRLETSSSHQWSMVLWDAGEFRDAINNSQLFYGALYGSMLLMLIYHLFLFFSFNDRNYLFYVIYMGSAVLFLASLSGHVFQHLFPNHPEIANRSIPFLIANWMLATMVFVRFFLKIREKLKGFERVLKVVAILVGCIICLSPFGFTQTLTRVGSGMSIVVAFLVAAASAISWKRGDMAARFMTLSVCCTAVGVVLFALKSLGLAPSTIVTKYGMDMGTFIGSMLFAMALGDHVSRLRDERELAIIRHYREEAVKATNIAQIGDLAADVMSVSRSLNDVISDFTDSTADVAQAVMETQLTVGDLELGATEVEAKATQIAEASEQSAKETVKGEAAIRSTADIVEEISRDSLEILSMSRDLFARLEEVDSIITSVKAIADQSKILAVNASIEAAKSGKYGRGFSVIAKEVKNLAVQSKEATSQITDILTMAREATENILRKSDRGRRTTEEGVAMIAHSGELVSEISQAMAAHADTAHLILEAVKNQNQGLGDILRAVNQITTVATKNSDLASRMETGSANLDAAMDQLVLTLNSWGNGEEKTSEEEIS